MNTKELIPALEVTGGAFVGMYGSNWVGGMINPYIKSFIPGVSNGTTGGVTLGVLGLLALLFMPKMDENLLLLVLGLTGGSFASAIMPYIPAI